MSVSVKESSGVVSINQIHSQAVAMLICERFQTDAIAARVGALPGTAGLLVTVPGPDLAEIECILRELRIEPRRR